MYIIIPKTLAMEARKVMISVSELKILTAKHLLSEAGIESHSIDKRDSAHMEQWANIELYVDEEEADRARKLLIDNEVI